MIHDHPPNVSHTGCAACMEGAEAGQQRFQRGFTDEDVWGLNSHLGRHLAATLTVLRDNAHGCPPRLCEDGDVDAGMEKWKAILTEMIDGFREYGEHDGPMFPTPTRPLELLTEWWDDLWD